MVISPLSSPAPYDPRKLGFFLPDEFLVTRRVWSPIRFYGVEIVDEAATLAPHTTAHTSGRARMERRLWLWRRRMDSSFDPFAPFFYGR